MTDRTDRKVIDEAKSSKYDYIDEQAKASEQRFHTTLAIVRWSILIAVLGLLIVLVAANT